MKFLICNLWIRKKKQYIVLVKVINEYVVRRKAELLEEMHKEEIYEEYDKKTEIQNLKALLADVRYRNDQMRRNLNQQQVRDLPEETQNISTNQELTTIHHQIDQQFDLHKSLTSQISEISRTLRKQEKYCNTLQEQVDLYSFKQPHVQLKEFQNKQAYQAAKKQNNKIKLALSEEKDWQEKFLTDHNQLYDVKNQIVKENLEFLCSQEEKIDQLEKQLSQTQQQMEELSFTISMKFNKIEQCAEFLDELDDFDKIILIFVMEDPDTFELTEILENAKFQLSRPKNRMQIADSEQEYIDRARFSSVSSRMRIFLKFHNNNLDQSIDNLIQVYRKLQFQEMTLTNRYEDLLSQKSKLKRILEGLNALEFYPMDDILFERDDEHMNLEEVNVEQALVSKNQQTRLVDTNAQFLIRMFSMLTNSLSRMVNSLINIKEVLKTCPSEYFDQDFYLKWTYNKLYQKIATIQQDLEQQYKIRIVAKDPAIRASNQLLNAIYDHLEDRPQKRKTFATKAPKQTMHDILTNFNYHEQKNVQDCVASDILLFQFFSVKDLQTLLCTNENIDEETVIQIIKTEGYEVALTNARNQLRQLLSLIEEAVLECKNINESQNQAKALQQKYKLQDLMEKHMNSYEFKPKEWKKDLMEKKIKQLKPLNGQPNEDVAPSPIVEQIKPINQKASSSTPKLEPLRTCKTEQSPNQMKRFIIAIDAAIPSCTQSQANQLQSDPIFIHLHHMNKKIKNLNRSQTSQQYSPPQSHAFEVFFSKKSVELSRDSMTNLQLKTTPIQTSKIILRTASKCPKIVNTSNSTYMVSTRSKCYTKTSTEQKQEAPLSSKSQLSSAYGSTNKKLQDFFHMTSVRKR